MKTKTINGDVMNNSNQLHKVENNNPPLFFVSYRIGYKGEDEELKENTLFVGLEG